MGLAAQTACTTRYNNYLSADSNRLNKEKTMTTDVPRTSAQIYQFPIRVRKIAADQRQENQPSPELRAVSGGGWYHDAAIQESKLVRER